YIGYGTPKASIALKIMNGDNKIALKDKKEIKVRGNEYWIKRINEKERIIIFHKKNENIVIDQDYMSVKKDKCKITKKKNAKRTTIMYDNKVVEIIWD
ncbi:MAG: serine protease, partial [Thermoflexibacter sp.]|nr:serine protease [Thermoflexibacter sp.]